MKANTLILFTNTFPYNTGEEFLETEILFLAKSFNKVIIYPYIRKGNQRCLPENVEVKSIPFNDSFSVKSIIINYCLTLVNILKYELIFSKKRLLFYKYFKVNFNTLIWNFNHALQLKSELQKYNLHEVKLYSYWFAEWGRLLSLVHRISLKEIKFITRVHGYDYEPSRREDAFIPFRNFEMHQVSKIFSISNYGLHIIKNEYPFFKNAQLARLGVCDNGINPINIGVFHIVSCSALIELKRVELIIDILKHITFNVKWTHFGDGELLADIAEKSKKLPTNIIYKLDGFKSNSDVLDFYKNTPIDLFINVSRIEGVPVSIMEAISFGIPCVGCMVGGVPEIVNEQTGFLIDREFNPKDVSVQIELYNNKSKTDQLNFRKGVKLFWEQNYNANKNYDEFINTIFQ